jgi:hypothetical protein
LKKIPLSDGSKARVNNCFYGLLKKFRWYVIKAKHTQYAVWYRTSREKIAMHQMILGARGGQVVDHIDGDGLNNQVANLRVCDWSQNVMHSVRRRRGRSRYKGVDRHHGKWRARIAAYGQRMHLGNYATEEEAARAYDRAAVRHHGEFAVLNFGEVRVRKTVKAEVLFKKNAGLIKEMLRVVEDKEERRANAYVNAARLRGGVLSERCAARGLSGEG